MVDIEKAFEQRTKELDECRADRNRLQRKMDDATAYCTGKFPCEASTAAAYLEKECDELRSMVRGSSKAEAAGLFHFAMRLASFLWSVDRDTVQIAFDWTTEALDNEYSEDCPERTLMLGFHAAIAQRIEEIEESE